MAYLYGAGYGVAQISLAPLIWQPRTDTTVQPVVRNNSASGVVHEHGLWIPLLYSAFDDPEDYQAQLAQIGLTSALEAEGTWYLPDDAYVWRRYNGLAIKPQQGEDIRRSGYFIKDVTILVIKLRLLV